MRKMGQRVNVRGPGALLAFFALAVLVLGLTSASAFAATATWDGGGTGANWGTAANWVGDTLPANGDDLVFPFGAAKPSNNNNLLSSVGAVTIGGNYTISSGVLPALTVNGGVTVLSGATSVSWNVPTSLGADQSFTCPSGCVLSVVNSLDTNGHTLTVAGDGDVSQTTNHIKGSGGVVKDGAGTLTLSDGNQYTGKTVVNAGTVFITDDTGLGADPGSFVADQMTLNGGTLQMDGTFTTIADRGMTLGGAALVYVTSGSTVTWAGAIAGSHALDKEGNGTLVLAGTNTYSGGTAVNSGVVIVTGSIASSLSSLVVASGAGLTGTGTIHDNSVIQGLLGAGNDLQGDVGTLNAEISMEWQNNGLYLCDITPSTNDVIAINGTLNITSAGADHFIVQPFGNLTGWDPSVNHAWTIATTTEGITGFVYGSTIGLDMSHVTAPGKTGEFWLDVYNGSLLLRYTHGTPVVIKSFKAYVRADGKVKLVWRTAAQSHLAGFMLQRKDHRTGKWVLVRRAMVPAKLDRVTAGYSLIDPAARAGRKYTYRLRVIELGGGVSSVGPYVVVPLAL